MKSANAYLHFAGNTEEVFQFYRSVFGGEFTNVTRFSDMPDNSMGVAASELNLIANIGLPIGDSIIMATDVVGNWPSPVVGTNFHVAVETDSAEEADDVFGRLFEGGQVVMPLARTEWADSYGIGTDRYGIQWMVMYTGAGGTAGI